MASADGRGGISDRDLGRSAADRATGRDNFGGRDNAPKQSNKAATKSKQADLQSFGATPTSSELSRKEAAELGDAIDRMGGAGGFFSDLLGIRQEVALNPKTNAWDVKSYKEFNPVSALAGMAANAVAGPLGGAAVGIIGEATGVFDDFGFEVDLGFGGEPSSKSRDRERDDGRAVQEAGNPTAAQSVGAQSAQEGAIDKAVKEILEGNKKFSFFDMPTFKLLDPEFGADNKQVDLAELLMQNNALKLKETG